MLPWEAARGDGDADLDFSMREEMRQQERERERGRELRRHQEKTPDVHLRGESQADTQPTENSKAFPDESPCFQISHIVLQGVDAGYFNYALRTVTDGPDAAVGRCLGTAGINKALTRVQNAIVADGFVTTRILAGQQNLRSGELVMTVLPGRVHGLRLAAAADPRGNRWNAMPIHDGDLLNLRDIEQGLENFKRVPTAEAEIQIEPAAFDAADAAGREAGKAGQSDLVIQYRQAMPFRLNLSLDDSGSTATGKYQAGATISYDNWWTLNDLFYFSLNGDLGGGSPERYGTRSYNAHYSIPFGYWLLGMNASANRYYQAVAGINKSYIYSGRSETREIKLSRVLYRDARRRTSLSLRGLLRSSNNFIDDTEVQVQRRRTASWELGLAHREFIGNASFDAGLAYRRGTGAFDAMRAPEERFGEGTSRFRLITANLGASLPMRLAAPWGMQPLRYTLSVRGQWNATPLTSQDRFSIGGRYTVRGFDGETSLMAERGWLVRNELGAALGASGQEAYLGFDYGEVGGRSASLLPGKSLAGAAAGLRGGFAPLKGFYYDIFAAIPLSKPEKFQTASLNAGFNLNWSY
ncbi:MAG TPA: ShlB/FhaC/HecB family hemolysin secretion/activation protein [Herbaspirillum sp.]